MGAEIEEGSERGWEASVELKTERGWRKRLMDQSTRLPFLARWRARCRGDSPALVSPTQHTFPAHCLAGLDLRITLYPCIL